jgi:outer membrane receptor protein involved in Fe transport
MPKPFPKRHALICAVAVVASPAHAATLEETIVTATLLPNDAQRISVTILDAEQINRRAAEHLEDLLSAAPNTNFASGANRGRFFQIRGIGERSQFSEPLNASVALILDGIDVTGIGGAATLFDIQQTEVLRGPQGTLQGANALAGLLNLTSATATFENTLNVSAGLENYDGREVGVIANRAISEEWATRLSYHRYQSDGYIDNTFLGRSDTNNRDETTLRGQVVRATDNQRLEIAGYWIDVDNGYDGFSLDNTRQTLSDEPGRDATETLAGRVRYQYFGSEHDIWIQGSVAQTDLDYSYDEDWSFVGIAPDWEYSSFDRYQRTRDMASLEARIQPARAGIASVNWVAGVYLRSEDEDLRRDYTYLEGPFTSNYATDTGAVFGQLTLPLSPSLSIFSGLRLERRQFDYRDNAQVDESFADNFWTGKLGLNYQHNPEHSLYVSISRGVRSGGVNATLLASAEAFENQNITEELRGFAQFEDEALINIEAGWRYENTAGTLASGLTVFTMDRQDQQARGSLVIPRPDGSTAFIDYTDNAVAGTNRGIEWQWQWQPLEQLRLGGAVGYLDATFDRYLNINGDDLSGRDQPQAPRYQYQLEAIWSPTPQLTTSVEVTGMDRYYFSDRHELESPSRTLVNTSIRYQGDDWSVTLWGRNIFDEDYFVRGFGSFGNDPRKEYRVEPYVQYGEPAMFGLSVDYQFKG